YGKLPSRGDFVGRGLPPGFLRAWDDAWQQALAEVAWRHGSAEAKQRLRGMGVQRFMARLAGEPLVWAGVVMPSEDRVGRSFPLMVAE
ncbi:type VI secretion system-associated protein TagF, partial [Klebsiella pneumoniae]|nr:type VI secretion system-associated protein TagF [Klebsiella pneumoniae]